LQSEKENFLCMSRKVRTFAAEIDAVKYDEHIC